MGPVSRSSGSGAARSGADIVVLFVVAEAGEADIAVATAPMEEAPPASRGAPAGAQSASRRPRSPPRGCSRWDGRKPIHSAPPRTAGLRRPPHVRVARPFGAPPEAPAGSGRSPPPKSRPPGSAHVPAVGKLRPPPPPNRARRRLPTFPRSGSHDRPLRRSRAAAASAHVPANGKLHRPSAESRPPPKSRGRELLPAPLYVPPAGAGGRSWGAPSSPPLGGSPRGARG